MRLPDLGERGQGWVWLQALLMAAIPTVGGLAPPWPAPMQLPMLALGISLVLLGCALLVAGILGLGDSFGVFPEPTPNRGWSRPASTVGPATRSSGAGSSSGSGSEWRSRRGRCPCRVSWCSNSSARPPSRSAT